MDTKTNPARDCYVDTSALIAFLDRSDSYHPVFERLFSNPPPLITSALVIVEGHGWFLRRYDARRAGEFLVFIDEAPISIQAFGKDQLRKTRPILAKFADQDLTLADAHGLAIISERRIVTCWSTDRHLALTGATLVR
ncbi:MAG TPA: PIN domain-containing protein [Bryobacteraceae bacterium]|nr:PIN domain-containing protein [Bryobacteraceae bacterium]